MTDNQPYKAGSNPFENNAQKSNSKYFKTLKDGDFNNLRFLKELDEFVKLPVHSFVKVDSNGQLIADARAANKSAGEKYVGSFMCIHSEENLLNGITCPLCEAGLRYSWKFMAPAIDRSDGEVKLFESDKKTIYTQLAEQFKTDGTITKTDFKISRTGKTQDDTRYAVSVVTSNIGELSSEEKELANKVDISKAYPVMAREQILAEIVERAKGKTNSDSSSQATTPIVPTVPVTPVAPAGPVATPEKPSPF